MAKIKNWNSCTPAEQIERYEHVVEVLKSMTPHERREHWNMSLWGVATECGTVHCAAGKCGLTPWFIKRGLKLKPTPLEKLIWKDHEGNTIIPNALGDSEEIGGAGSFEGGDNAVERFFGAVGTDSIFTNDELRPVSEVINEVKLYIKHLKALPKLVKKFREDNGHAPERWDIPFELDQ